MDNSIQTKLTSRTQYTDNTEMPAAFKNNDIKFDEKITSKQLSNENRVNVKDIKNSINNPITLIFNKENISKIKPDMSNDVHRKQILMSQIKNLSEHYQHLFGRVINDDKEILELFSTLRKSVSENTLPSGKDLEKLSSAIEKFKASDKFTNGFLDKDKRKAFISSFESTIKNIDSFNKGQALENKFIQTSQKVTSNLDTLIDAIGNSKNKNSLTDSLRDIMAKYKEALASGDKQLIALYSGLIDKITNQINNGATGAQIAETMKQYNNLVTKIYDNNASSEEVNNELKAFLGDELYNVFISDLSDSPTVFSGGEGGGGTVSPMSNGGNKPEGNDEQGGQGGKKPNGGNNKDGNPIDILRARANKEPGKPRPMKFDGNDIKKIEVMTSTEIKQVIESIPGLKEGLKELEKINKELIKDQINLFNFTNDQKILSSNINPEKDSVQDNIKERIRKLIENAEIMEQNLNLEFETGDTTIVSLLEKFRDIITKLDMDSKNNALKSLESILIDQKNQSYIRDMELRWKSLDKAKSELNKIFEELKQKNIA
jgi:hypothetical protein